MARASIWIFVLLSLVACSADREVFHLRPEAEAVGTLHEVFTVTNRGARSDGGFGRDRTQDLTFLRTDISVPPNHIPGQTKINLYNPNPARHFAIAEQQEIAGKTAFQRTLRKRLSQRPSNDQDIMLFVHGFNTSYSEGLFRMAQVQHDMSTPGLPVLFSWPSSAEFLGYGHDHDSMIFSRDALQQTLFSLNSVAPKRTLLVAHSLGAMLSMETLRQIEIKQPGWSQRNLQGVVLIAPDIDIDIFLNQLDWFDRLPQPFIIFVSSQDKALEISGLINGRPNRLGRDSDIDTLSDYPILVIDISQFADGRYADHFTVGSSPELMDFLTSPELETVWQSQDFNAGVALNGGQHVRTSALRAKKAIQWVLFPKAQEAAPKP